MRSADCLVASRRLLRARHPLGIVAAVEHSAAPGAVFMLRGLWAMSPGFDDLGRQLAAAGVHTTIYSQDQWTMLADHLITDRAAAATPATVPDPIVLIGHSFARTMPFG